MLFCRECIILSDTCISLLKHEIIYFLMEDFIHITQPYTYLLPELKCKSPFFRFLLTYQGLVMVGQMLAKLVVLTKTLPSACLFGFSELEILWQLSFS